MRFSERASDRARKAVSAAFLIKSALGFSVTALALFGVTVPHLGIEPTFAGQGLAAGAGGIIGALLALKA